MTGLLQIRTYALLEKSRNVRIAFYVADFVLVLFLIFTIISIEGNLAVKFLKKLTNLNNQPYSEQSILAA